MKAKNIYLIIGGIINLFTALLHLIGGQTSLINPLTNSNLELQVRTELLGVWHMVTTILFMSSIVLLYFGFKQKGNSSKELIKFIGYIYILFSIAFIIVSIINSQLAPQWTLLLPIGILALIGVRKLNK